MNLSLVFIAIEDDLMNLKRFLFHLEDGMNKSRSETGLIDPQTRFIKVLDGNQKELIKYLQDQNNFRFQYHLYSTIATIYSCLEFNLEYLTKAVYSELGIEGSRKKLEGESNIEYRFACLFDKKIWIGASENIDEIWSQIKLFHKLRVLIVHYNGLLDHKRSNKACLKINGVELHENGRVYLQGINVSHRFLVLVERLFLVIKDNLKSQPNYRWIE